MATKSSGHWITRVSTSASGSMSGWSAGQRESMLKAASSKFSSASAKRGEEMNQPARSAKNKETA